MVELEGVSEIDNYEWGMCSIDAHRVDREAHYSLNQGLTDRRSYFCGANLKTVFLCIVYEESSG